MACVSIAKKRYTQSLNIYLTQVQGCTTFQENVIIVVKKNE